MCLCLLFFLKILCRLPIINTTHIYVCTIFSCNTLINTNISPGGIQIKHFFKISNKFISIKLKKPITNFDILNLSFWLWGYRSNEGKNATNTTFAIERLPLGNQIRWSQWFRYIKWTTRYPIISKLPTYCNGFCPMVRIMSGFCF